MEAECPFISFKDLLDKLEDLVVDVCDRVLKSEFGSLVHELNPDFVAPKKPFMRMDYTQAIEYLRENDIRKDDGTFYEFGEVHFFHSYFTFSCFPFVDNVQNNQVNDDCDEGVYIFYFPRTFRKPRNVG